MPVPRTRRAVLALVSGGAAAALLTPGSVASPAIVRRRVRLAVDVRNGPGVRSCSEIAARLSERLSAATDGHIALEIGGDANAWIGSAHELADMYRSAAFGYFAGLPGQSSREAAAFRAWLATDGAVLMNRLGNDHGITCLAVSTAPRPGLIAKHKIWDTPALHRRCVVSRGLMRDIYHALGAIVVPSARFEDGTELFDSMPDIKPNAAAQLMNYAQLAPDTETTVLALNESVWRDLDAASQATLAAVARHSLFRSLLSPRRVQYGLVQDAPNSLRVSMRAVTSAILAELATRDALARRIDDSYRRAICS